MSPTLWKNSLFISIFVLALGMTITLLVFWILFIIQDYHTIRELTANKQIDATGRWVILTLGIIFFTLIIVTLTVFFANLMRGAHFKLQQKNFINMMTHELRLPMSSIQMFAQTLKQRPVSSEQREQFIDYILNDCERMNSLVDHLLKLQQIEQRRFPLDRQEIDLRAFVEDFLDRWPRPVERRIEDLSAFANLDPNLMQYALANLVNNAEKYGNGHPPCVELTRVGAWAEISVLDKAPVIPVHYRKKIFKRYFRVPSLATRRQSGTGLGLFIVKYILKLHKGHINVETGPDGQGNRFTLSIPIMS